MRYLFPYAEYIVFFQVIMVVKPIFGLSAWQQVYSIQSAQTKVPEENSKLHKF